MENRFAAIMAKRTDEELIRVVTVERGDYQAEAVEAAEAEMAKRNIDVTVVEQIKGRLAQEQEVQKQQNQNRVSRFSRIVHLIVDTMAYQLLAFMLFVVPAVFSYDGQEYIFSIIFFGSYVAAFFGYYVLMEHFFQKTLGKFITKTKVVTNDGARADIRMLMVRTFCRLLPFDGITFLVLKTGFHDLISQTRVVRDES